MQFDAITKLRLSFLALGLALLLPLAWLIHSVNVRVEAQRRLRHQVVAERIFDELERELTHVLEEESARHSSGFDHDIPNGSWEPYVVGYFRTDGPNNYLLDGVHLEPERRQRVSWALARDGVFLPPPPIEPVQQQGALERQPEGTPSEAKPTSRSAAAVPPAAPAPVSPASKANRFDSPDEVLRKLNRAKEERPANGFSR